MNNKHLTHILHDLEIGELKNDPTEVFGSRGGAKIWKVNTQSKSYAIKQLSPDLDVNNESIIRKYELSEDIAAEFSKQGINAITALSKANKHLFIFTDKAYLVYPWIEGSILDRNQISEPHAIKIAEIIAQLHSAQFSMPHIKLPRFDIHTPATINAAIHNAIQNNCLFARTLQDHQDTIIEVNQQYQSIIPILHEESVITHGDIDQLNVIWSDNDKPVLIDWESARLMNPTQEIVRSSLSWSGCGENNFNIEIYKKMLQTYLQYGGKYNSKHTNAALHSVYGSIINWILYNIHSACNSKNSSTMDTANNEINNAISGLKKLKKLIPKLNMAP
jgi:thiamine kinase-like enzyme